ncbi:kinesin-like protein KIN-14R isoform X4 [Silene latifolia]|uniref:kinesin-like protein KIN-14R isoform X4 n=1 Tax=Silene latifolia TaxID=37657 RepID=UPI003D782650
MENNSEKNMYYLADVLSRFGMFAVVGANKPLPPVDFRIYVMDDGLLLMRVKGLLGTAVDSGICIYRVPEMGGQDR